MIPLAPVLLLTLLSPARAQDTLEGAYAQVRNAARPNVDELLAKLKSGSPEEQTQVLDQLSLALGGLRSGEQDRVVEALQAAAQSEDANADVRRKSLETLGKAVAWLREDESKKKSALALIGALSRTDASDTLRFGALKGLVDAAGHLPSGDIDLHKSVVECLLDVIGASSQENERSLARLAFYNYLEASGAGTLYRDSSTQDKFGSDFLTPLENDPEVMYKSGWSVDSRLILVYSLKIVAFYAGGEDTANFRPRIRRILDGMAEREPDSALKLLIRKAAQSIPG